MIMRARFRVRIFILFMDNILFSSRSEEWSTPQELFDSLDSEFHFDLDPCASISNHKCDFYFTKKDDGLSKDWTKYRVFCNPPYGRKIKDWIKKAYLSSLNGALVVLLIPARTDTSYFHDFILGKAEIRFIRGRLRFNGSKNPAPFPSMIVVYNNYEKLSAGIV